MLLRWLLFATIIIICTYLFEIGKHYVLDMVWCCSPVPLITLQWNFQGLIERHRSLSRVITRTHTPSCIPVSRDRTLKSMAIGAC